eukprot:maker-scaffold963_size76285-snap-gene-0.15 protein:Tk09000 transcript:maker-scaffold963_size76285-snap-gene-0.15-mRNA-1 annotation:"af461035_1collagenolytic serine protease"
MGQILTQLVDLINEEMVHCLSGLVAPYGGNPINEERGGQRGIQGLAKRGIGQAPEHLGIAVGLAQLIQVSALVLVSLALVGSSMAFPKVNRAGLQDRSVLYPHKIQKYIKENGPFPHQRIVGGQEAEPHSWPFIVALSIDDSFFCGGTILSDQWILTAAHCLDGAGYVEVTAGAHNQATLENSQVKLTSTTFTVNPDYDSINIIEDTAVIQLPEKLDLSGDFIKAVKMATADPADGELVTSVGWGITSDFGSVSDVLNQVDVPVLNYDECLDYWQGVLDPKQLCIDTKGSKGTCGGDSGGPTMYNGAQVGITSFGGFSCTMDAPAGLVSVAQYQEWICANTEGVC